MRKMKLPRKVRFVLLDTATIEHIGGTDEWGDPVAGESYSLSHIRIDRQGIRSVSTQGDSVTHMDVFMVYPDYAVVMDKDGNQVDCPDLSKLNTDDNWKIDDSGVKRAVANVNVIKQPFTPDVFCYELEVV